MNRIDFNPLDPIPAEFLNGIQQELVGAVQFLAQLLGATGGYAGSATNNASVIQNATPDPTNVIVKGPATLWIAPLLGTDSPRGVPFYLGPDVVVPVPVLNTSTGQSRQDLICAFVNLGNPSTYSYVVAQGTPATTGSQVDPATPNNALKLARLTRAHGHGNIVNANLTDLRVAVKVLAAHQA